MTREAFPRNLQSMTSMKIMWVGQIINKRIRIIVVQGLMLAITSHNKKNLVIRPNISHLSSEI